MRLIFMGTPDFAYMPLKTIIQANHEVVAVITQPDKPNTRGNKIAFSPVKVLALENEIDVLQPADIKDAECIKLIQEYKPEGIVVVAYGQLLPKEILEYPKYGCINIHASLLPKYRGSAPIHWSIINGETKTGVTTMYMDIGMDTGDIIYQEEVSIGENVTVGELYDDLTSIGAKLILKTLSDIKLGIAPRIIQDNSVSSYAPLLSKDTGKINWCVPTREIANHVRGTNPWPGAFTNYMNKKLKVFATKNYEKSTNPDTQPGTILEYEKNKGLLIKTGDGGIYLDVIQFPNKKRMHIDDFVKGNRIEIGSVLS